MTPTFQTLAEVVFALALAAVLRWILPAGRSGGPLPAQRLGEKIEALALKLLLPLIVFEALSRHAVISQLLLAAGVGFALPPLCLAAYALCRRFLPGFTHGPEIGFLAASFGGGNRGTALLVVLMAGAPDFAAQLQWFALVDLGNFVFMLVLTPWLLARHYGARQEGGARQRWKAWLGSYLAATVAVVLACVLADTLWAGFGAWLADSSSLRKALFTVLVFTALGLRFRLGDARAMGRGLLLFALLRLLAGAALLVLVPIEAARPLLLPLGILLLMPPSSILPSLIARTAVDGERLAYASSFATAANLVYLVVLALAGALALLR